MAPVVETSSAGDDAFNYRYRGVNYTSRGLNSRYGASNSSYRPFADTRKALPYTFRGLHSTSRALDFGLEAKDPCSGDPGRPADE